MMNLERRIKKLEQTAAAEREPLVIRIVYENPDGSVEHGETIALAPGRLGTRPWERGVSG
jgi:hypothetical protein